MKLKSVLIASAIGIASLFSISAIHAAVKDSPKCVHDSTKNCVHESNVKHCNSGSKDSLKCVHDSTKTCTHASTGKHCQGAVEYKDPVKNATAVPMVAKAPNKEIIFFMNPNGHPCQMQDAILGEIKDSLLTLAAVRYYKTTNDADRSAFDKYGIRGLPTLVIADKTGKELSRFTPGIQSKETILNALHAK